MEDSLPIYEHPNFNTYKEIFASNTPEFKLRLRLKKDGLDKEEIAAVFKELKNPTKIPKKKKWRKPPPPGKQKNVKIPMPSQRQFGKSKAKPSPPTSAPSSDQTRTPIKQPANPKPVSPSSIKKYAASNPSSKKTNSLRPQSSVKPNSPSRRNPASVKSSPLPKPNTNHAGTGTKAKLVKSTTKLTAPSTARSVRTTASRPKNSLFRKMHENLNGQMGGSTKPAPKPARSVKTTANSAKFDNIHGKLGALFGGAPAPKKAAPKKAKPKKLAANKLGKKLGAVGAKKTGGKSGLAVLSRDDPLFEKFKKRQKILPAGPFAHSLIKEGFDPDAFLKMIQEDASKPENTAKPTAALNATAAAAPTGQTAPAPKPEAAPTGGMNMEQMAKLMGMMQNNNQSPANNASQMQMVTMMNSMMSMMQNMQQQNMMNQNMMQQQMMNNNMRQPQQPYPMSMQGFPNAGMPSMPYYNQQMGFNQQQVIPQMHPNIMHQQSMAAPSVHGSQMGSQAPPQSSIAHTHSLNPMRGNIPRSSAPQTAAGMPADVATYLHQQQPVAPVIHVYYNAHPDDLSEDSREGDFEEMEYEVDNPYHDPKDMESVFSSAKKINVTMSSKRVERVEALPRSYSSTLVRGGGLKSVRSLRSRSSNRSRRSKKRVTKKKKEKGRFEEVTDEGPIDFSDLAEMKSAKTQAPPKKPIKIAQTTNDEVNKEIKDLKNEESKKVVKAEEKKPEATDSQVKKEANVQKVEAGSKPEKNVSAAGEEPTELLKVTSANKSEAPVMESTKEPDLRIDTNLTETTNKSESNEAGNVSDVIEKTSVDGNKEEISLKGRQDLISDKLQVLNSGVNPEKIESASDVELAKRQSLISEKLSAVHKESVAIVIKPAREDLQKDPIVEEAPELVSVKLRPLNEDPELKKDQPNVEAVSVVPPNLIRRLTAGEAQQMLRDEGDLDWQVIDNEMGEIAFVNRKTGDISKLPPSALL
eukprot:maker-scaffold_1-snap-gene-9.11-mRNA-1 protein AED:0.00 eAED:0.00 QI:48/1/1/1/1/1/2/111/974